MTATAAPPPAALRPHDPANLVEVDDVKVHFPIRAGIFQTTKATVKAVDGVTFDVRRGETLGLVGESGCGKSTIGRAMIRLRDATSGTVRFDGLDLGTMSSGDLRRTRRRMQIIFQDPYGSLDPRMTVGSIIAEPIETHHLAEGDAKRDRIADLLQLVGLDPQYVKRYPHEFSGGQRQRIGVARALAVEPEFIVCDEPISALDVSIQAQVLNLLTDLKKRLGLTYLFVAHDLSVVKHISDRVAVMYLGKIVEIGPPDQLYSAPGHPYTRALLSAVPVPDPVAERKRKRVILKGDVPSPVNPPPGCRFHTRCWLYERLGQPEDCRTIDPPTHRRRRRWPTTTRPATSPTRRSRPTSGSPTSATRMIRRGTPAAAIASLESGKNGGLTDEQIAAFAAPAFADLGKESTEVETTEGLSAEDPNAARYTDGPTGPIRGGRARFTHQGSRRVRRPKGHAILCRVRIARRHRAVNDAGGRRSNRRRRKHETSAHRCALCGDRDRVRGLRWSLHQHRAVGRAVGRRAVDRRVDRAVGRTVRVHRRHAQGGRHGSWWPSPATSSGRTRRSSMTPARRT